MRLFVPFHWCALFRGVCMVPAYPRWPKGFYRETFHPEFRCEAQCFLGRTWSAPEASETTAVERVCVRGPARRLKFPRPVNHRTSPGLVQSSLPLISATTRSTISAHSLPLLSASSKCDMLMFIWWRKLDSFHQIHRRTRYRPNGAYRRVHNAHTMLITHTWTRSST